ncbi:GNAT family N-acetyltransferase [Actinospica sp. MGRD01-02]|uniref:GNAT family N-acetyltransferase n=1 Tax=Actinospica acidithermotolerans TaxID=2828514 RepID=A0A941EF68_9ACTN|nr:GNAT family N-acetyltransferase [Actinospica acidithermotolerans]MBR7827949.1 GNAT family N-acetyltransferase [Actinospica acidithermotolerans]
MDSAAVLALFDRQLRRDHHGEGPGDRVERVGDVVRLVASGGAGWCGVVWSDLNARNADAAIAEQVRYFTELGREFEWKHYSHDMPADLADRLLKAGFAPEEPEALMIAEIAGLPTEPRLPEGVRIVEVTDAAGVAQMVRAHDAAFGRPSPRLEQQLLRQVADRDASLVALVVLAGDDEPVCAARLELHKGTEFGSLWGGGTAPRWRGQGIYKATVAYRARIAAERGCRYLQVDASDDSRPILGRLGFHPLAVTTPFVYEP